jgi:hypothetical protein
VATGHQDALASPAVVTVLGFAGLITTTLLGVGSIHRQLNSRIDQLVRSESQQAFAAGGKEARAQAAAAVGQQQQHDVAMAAAANPPPPPPERVTPE